MGRRHPPGQPGLPRERIKTVKLVEERVKMLSAQFAHQAGSSILTGLHNP